MQQALYVCCLYVHIILSKILCRVKLAYNRQTTEAVAVKIIETDNRKSVWDEVRKEVSQFFTVCVNTGQSNFLFKSSFYMPSW